MSKIPNSTKEVFTDARFNLIKQILYGTQPVKQPIPKSSIHTPIIDHPIDAIERAYLHYRQTADSEVVSNLNKKYKCMRLAMLDLEKHHPRLFEKAKQNDLWKKTQDLILFPSRLRVPSETPPTNGWKSRSVV